MPSQANGSLGRAATLVADAVQEQIAGGALSGGQFLPTERELAERHSVDRKTVRRALKSLEGRGLISAVPRQGYRILPGAGDPDRGCPLACVLQAAVNQDGFTRLTGSSERLLGALREAVDVRGWSLLAVGSGGRTVGEVLEQVRSARSFGLALDIDNPELIAALAGSGLPAVLINSWIKDSGVDSVMQDGQLGGLLAAEHLAGRGCRRVAWMGHDQPSAHVMDRLGGAVAGLRQEGLELNKNLTVWTETSIAREAARKLLSRKDRPDGIIALWRGLAVEATRAAADVGLTVGRDVEIIGWCPEESYEAQWRKELSGGPVPPAITWSTRTMAETALARLAERREHPDLPALRVKVPVKLRFDGED